MSALQNALDEYLTIRRALGYNLYGDGLVLQQFVQFAESEEADFITTRLALRWATQPVNAQPAHWARRLSIVRGFAKYRSASDPRTEVPPAYLLPYRVYRPAPYIYTDNEVRCLIKAAMQLPSAVGLRRYTYATLFDLIAVSGMRIGELLHLDRDDVDLTQAILTVRDGKFGKTRWIPLHSSTQQALQEYAFKRDRLCPNPQVPSFFIAEHGVRLTFDIVRYTFIKLSRQTGLRGPTDTHGPRLHDFRHRFTVNTLLEWYRSGTDVNRHLPELATYLGHVHVTDTYWYLSATPPPVSPISFSLSIANNLFVAQISICTFCVVQLTQAVVETSTQGMYAAQHRTCEVAHGVGGKLAPGACCKSHSRRCQLWLQNPRIEGLCKVLSHSVAC